MDTEKNVFDILSAELNKSWLLMDDPSPAKINITLPNTKLI
jgi:hypothetical protein